MNENQIIYKLKSYLHHADFPKELLNEKLFKQLIDDRKIMYNHSADKGEDKYSEKKDLSILDSQFIPSYITNNKVKFNEWLI